MKGLKSLLLTVVMLGWAIASQATTVLIDGHVYTTDETPVADIEVQAILGADYQDTLFTTTDADGYYQFDIPEGIYQVRLVTGFGYCDGLQETTIYIDTALHYTYDFYLCADDDDDSEVEVDSVCLPMFYYALENYENPLEVHFLSIYSPAEFDTLFTDAQIDYGDGVTEEFHGEASHTYSSEGRYTVVVTAHSLTCDSTVSYSLSVVVSHWELYFVDFSYTFDPDDPSGLTVIFNAYSYPAEGVTYRWDFGDGSTYEGPENEVTHVYSESGEYIVTLIMFDSDMYSDTAQGPVWAGPSDSTWFDEPECEALFYTEYDGDSVTFHDISWPGLDAEITAYAWDFGDGSVSTLPNPGHRYTEAGTYLVTLSITTDHGCTSSFSQYVYIGDFVDSSVAPLFYPNEGDDSLEVLFYNLSEVEDGDWVWDFGDGEKAQGLKLQIVSHTYQNPGEYTVRLTDNSSGDAYVMDMRVEDNNVTPLVGYAVRKSVTKAEQLAEFDQQIRIYPIPVKDVLNVDLGKPTDVRLQIINVTGEVILDKRMSAERIMVNTTFLQPGVYMLKVNGKVYKFIKQ